MKTLLAFPHIEVNTQHKVCIIFFDCRVDGVVDKQNESTTFLVYTLTTLFTSIYFHSFICFFFIPKDGDTALICASRNEHIDIVIALLAHPDIDCKIANQAGKQALKATLDRDIKALIRAHGMYNTVVCCFL